MPPDATLTTPARNVKLNGAGHHQRDAVREQLECARHRRRNFLRPVPVRRPAGDELSAPLLPHPLAVIFGADWQGGGPDPPSTFAKNFARRKINPRPANPGARIFKWTANDSP